MNKLLAKPNSQVRFLISFLFVLISLFCNPQVSPELILPDYNEYERCLDLAFNQEKTLYYSLNSSGVLKFYNSKFKKPFYSVGTDSLQVTQAIFIEENKVLISAFSNLQKDTRIAYFTVYLLDLDSKKTLHVFKEVKLKGTKVKSKNDEQLYILDRFKYPFMDFNREKSLISIQFGGEIEVWNLEELNKVNQFRFDKTIGNSRLSKDGEFMIVQNLSEPNFFRLAEPLWSIKQRRKKNKLLTDACAIEFISEKGLLLLGNKSGELIVKDMKTWSTIRIIKFFDSWLNFIKYDSVNDQVIISDFNEEIKILNKESFVVEEEYSLDHGSLEIGVKDVIKDTTLSKIFFLFGDENTLHSYLTLYDLREKRILNEIEMEGTFNEDNLNHHGILVPGPNGAKFIENEDLNLYAINDYRSSFFGGSFLSSNEKYIAHTAYTPKKSNYDPIEVLNIWDLRTGRTVLSDSLSIGDSSPGGFDSKNQFFIYKIFEWGYSSKFYVDVSSGEKFFTKRNQDLPNSVNKENATLIDLKNNMNLVPIADTLHLKGQSNYLIIMLDSSKSTTIKYIASETNKIVWQINYGFPINYFMCVRDEFILIESSKDLTLDLIEIESGRKFSIMEGVEKKIRSDLNPRYKVNVDGDFLVVQKMKHHYDELDEFQFWDISRKTMRFNFKSKRNLDDTDIIIDTKRNHFISNHSGHYCYYSLENGEKLGFFDSEMEINVSDFEDTKKTFWLTSDNKLLIVVDGGSHSNRVKVYDSTTLKKLYTRIQSSDGNWIAFDKEMNYDGSDKALKDIYFVKGIQILTDYSPNRSKHVPGIIEKIMSQY